MLEGPRDADLASWSAERAEDFYRKAIFAAFGKIHTHRSLILELVQVRLLPHRLKRASADRLWI
jgi:hypothetical protein